MRLDAVLRVQRFLLLLEFGLLFCKCWRSLQFPLPDLLNVYLYGGRVSDTTSFHDLAGSQHPGPIEEEISLK